ncbi:hypothetical protein HK096_010280 [Nowakowskiella sp. JEL0078]|nr:hypothetical protein HK096_010280 [Nowakowskiella sp. JEL0078]
MFDALQTIDTANDFKEIEEKISSATSRPQSRAPSPSRFRFKKEQGESASPGTFNYASKEESKSRSSSPSRFRFGSFGSREKENTQTPQ